MKKFVNYYWYISEFSQHKKYNRLGAYFIRKKTFTLRKSLIESLISLIASVRSKRLCKHTIKIRECEGFLKGKMLFLKIDIIYI